MSLLVAMFFDIWIGLIAVCIKVPLSNTALLCMAVILAGGLAGLGRGK